MPRIHDPSVIRRLLETDRPWSVYALGDLAPRHFSQCTWYGDSHDPCSLVLLYHAFATPVLFTLGTPDSLMWMLDSIGDRPELSLQVKPEIVPLLQTRYRVLHQKFMYRMLLDQTPVRPDPQQKAVRVPLSNVEELQRLYADGDATQEAPDFFSPSMLDDGVFFGVWEGQELVAAAGTHLVDHAESVAAIGNVYTRRDRRGQGLGTAVTGAVVAELQAHKIRTIALNVAQTNAAALRTYERLGFVRYFEFCEGTAVKGEGVRG